MAKGMISRTDSEPMLSTYLNSKACREGIPVSGNFELTARCNFNCPMCYIHTGQESAALRERELSTGQWLALAEEARDMGMLFLLLTGGEPLLREDFPELYERLVKMGLMLSINTNAALYTPEIRAIFQRFPPIRINVSLYGGSDGTYTAQCGRPAFTRVLENLEQMKSDGLQVALNLSLTPYNVQDMEAVRAIAHRLDVPARAAAYMYPPVRTGGVPGENPGRFSPAQAGEALARWYALWDDRETFFTRVRAMELSANPCQDGPVCRAGRSSFWLSWDGRMLPCGTMEAGAAYPLREGFAAAWERVRRSAAAFRLPSACAACPSRDICPVCPAACMGETGSLTSPPGYLCEMSCALAREVEKQGREMEELY